MLRHHVEHAVPEADTFMMAKGFSSRGVTKVDEVVHPRVASMSNTGQDDVVTTNGAPVALEAAS